eukprot:COSAG05_NODE_7590_length_793_cov_0.933718_1_plen_131_part_10
MILTLDSVGPSASMISSSVARVISLREARDARDGIKAASFGRLRGATSATAMNPATVHLAPRGGRFNRGAKRGATPGTIECLLKTGANQPGPGQYKIDGTLRDTGGRFSLGNPKSDVEWMIYRAQRQPGPG